ncbi:hypothetical protein KIW84_015132 [Lathyrus oleraceus]|uniref:Uncharacterized protein n=1 Tax=Pisum sativum TaxID=3888 RepID=A0A9D5BPX8_PEA|nr:hypothetical protein KIW84_015132 [Pisum sativum]
MTHRYYLLSGYNDPSLKNTHVSSLPQELQPKVHRMLAATQQDIKTMSLGQIHQLMLEALEKLCSFHHQFSEVIEQKSKFTKASKKPYLEIKEAMYQHIMDSENLKSLIWTTLEWYSPLQWWKNQLKLVIDEVKERRLALESISQLMTVFFLYRPYQTDLATKLFDCKSYVHLWETIRDYPPRLKIIRELFEYVNFINLHDPKTINDSTTCISHEKFRRLEVGESSTQTIQQKSDSPIEAEFSEEHVEETHRKLMDHTYMMDGI